MPLKSTDFLAGGDIPEFDGVVTATRSQGFTIGAETDTFNPTAMPLKSTDFLEAGESQEFDGVVITARS